MNIAIGGLWPIFQSYLIPLLGVIVSAAVTWAAKKFTDKTHVEIEANYRDSIHSAAMTGINLALTKFGPTLDSVSIGTKSQVVADAAAWVLKSVPDALKYLGLTPDKVIPLVESKLNALLSTSSTTAVVSASPSAGGSA